MKNLVYLTSILLVACGSGATMTTSTPSPVPPTTTQTPYQIEQKANWTTPAPTNMNQGVGPVNLAESNFYFAGDFQIMESIPLFYDCMAGANIPIATDKGIYDQLATQYKNKITSAGEILKAQLHGYFINEATVDYPKKLVITYINDLSKGTICPRQKELPGTWTANLIGAQKGTVTLTLTNTFDFKCKITTDNGTEDVAGSWMMTSAQEIVLLFTTRTKYLGNNVAFNPNNMTLFIPTQTGTLIFKK